MNAGLIDFGRIAAICLCGYLCMHPRTMLAGVLLWLCRICKIFYKSIEPSVFGAAVACTSSGSVRAVNPCLSRHGIPRALIELRGVLVPVLAIADWPRAAGTLAITAEAVWSNAMQCPRNERTLTSGTP